MGYYEYEKMNISSISGQVITLTSSAQYFHYGHLLKTISSWDSSAYLKIDSKYNGELDMRGTVGHLTRNIKIEGSPEDGWGGTILVYHWIYQDSKTDISARGNIIFQGVELNNMGQKDNEKAGIRILSTNTDGDDTTINGCALHDCFGQCMNAQYSNHVVVNNTVFFNAYKFLLNGNYLIDW